YVARIARQPDLSCVANFPLPAGVVDRACCIRPTDCVSLARRGMGAALRSGYSHRGTTAALAAGRPPSQFLLRRQAFIAYGCPHPAGREPPVPYRAVPPDGAASAA